MKGQFSELDHAVQKRVVEEGYGFNGKSKWVCQSIVKFLSFHDKEFVIESISKVPIYGGKNINL